MRNATSDLDRDLTLVEVDIRSAPVAAAAVLTTVRNEQCGAAAIGERRATAAISGRGKRGAAVATAAAAVVDERGAAAATRWLVQWKGFPAFESTWQDKESLENAKEVLAQFRAALNVYEEWTRRREAGESLNLMDIFKGVESVTELKPAWCRKGLRVSLAAFAG